MGVGFKIRGTIAKYTFQQIPIERISRKIILFIQSAKGLVPGHSITYTHDIAEESLFKLYLYPAEAPLQIRLNTRSIYAEATTHSAGPGYHAYVISFLDNLAAAVGIKWQYMDLSKEFYDDTYYTTSGIFQDVQLTMAYWLQKVTSLLLERLTLSGRLIGGFSVSLPLDITPATIQTCWYPLGYIDFERLKEHLREEPFDDDITDLPINEYFFPWWHKEQNAAFYLNMALVFMWYYSPWVKTNDHETLVLYDKIRSCLETAYTLDSTLQYPFAEWAEIYAYLGEEEKMQQMLMRVTDPDKAKIGFRRGNVYFKLMHNKWSLRLPGSMIYKRVGEGESFYGVNRHICIVTLDNSVLNGYVITKETAFANSDEEGYIDFHNLAHRGIAGKIKQTTVTHADANINVNINEGLILYNILAKLLSPGGLLFISIYFTDPDDRRWAIGVLASVSYDKTTE